MVMMITNHNHIMMIIMYIFQDLMMEMRLISDIIVHPHKVKLLLAKILLLITMERMFFLMAT